MLNFRELLSNPNKFLESSPKIDRALFRFLWHSDYWDGPKSGMLLYQGKKFWFEVFEEQEDADYFRRFAIIELLESQISEEEYWHGLFRAKVGHHTDYDENGNRILGTLKPREIWTSFMMLIRAERRETFLAT